MRYNLRKTWVPTSLAAITALSLAFTLPSKLLAAKEDFELRAEVAVAIEQGPLLVRLEMTYRGVEPIGYLGVNIGVIGPLLVRPAQSDATVAIPAKSIDTPRCRAGVDLMRTGDSQITYISLRRFSDVLKPGKHKILIDWPIYVLMPDDPFFRPAEFALVSTRFPITVFSHRDGSRDLLFRGSSRVEPEPRRRFKQTLTMEVQPRSPRAIQTLCKKLVERCGTRDPSLSDDGLIDAVLKYDNEPAFDGIRARLLAYDAYGYIANPYVSQILENSAAEPKHLDQVFSNLDVNSIHAISGVLWEKTLPPYFLAVFKDKMLEAKSIWTRSMFLAKFPADCPAEWRDRLAMELSTCDRPFTVDEIAGQVRALDNDRYPIRQEAKREFLALGQRAVRSLKETLRKGGMSAEQAEVIQLLIAEIELKYPIGGPRTVKYPGVFEKGRHAFVGIAIPDGLKTVRKALDQICSEPDSPGAIEVLRALARNGSESLIGVEAAYLLKDLKRK